MHPLDERLEGIGLSLGALLVETEGFCGGEADPDDPSPVLISAEDVQRILGRCSCKKLRARLGRVLRAYNRLAAAWSGAVRDQIDWELRVRDDGK